MEREAYYETVANQEEIYLEETEEEVLEVLTSSDSHPSHNVCRAESLDEQLDHAAVELITGDPDDPPLSEEEVTQMLSPG